MKRSIPDILVEQLLLDELGPAEKARLLKEPEVMQRLEVLRASNAEILEKYPPAEMAARIEGRLEAAREAETESSRKGEKVTEGGRARPAGGRVTALFRRRGFVPVLAAAAVLALLVGIVPLLVRGGVSPDTGSGIRIKGAGPVLHVYRETAKGPELLKNGASASAHDLLQLSYVAAGARFGMVFSIDGSGTVTLHYPVGAALAARLQSGGEVALPHSYELDNAPRFERFYLVTSSSEFSVREILARARKAADAGTFTPSFPRGFQIASFTLNKETSQ